MKKNLLGSTGIEVSLLGLGTVKFGRNQGVKYPEPFSIPEDQTLITLLKTAQDLGVNLIDTAPAYGLSEERLGKLLKQLGVPRDSWIISTKAGEDFVDGQSFFDFTPNGICSSIERSLKRLNTDYLDIVLIHSDGNDIHNIEYFEVLNTLEHYKNKGLVRAIGMSTKTVEGGLLALKNSDVVMITYNPLEVTEQPVIAEALRTNKGIFIKKALASGHLPANDAIEFVAKEPGISSIIVGTLNLKHLQEIADFL